MKKTGLVTCSLFLLCAVSSISFAKTKLEMKKDKAVAQRAEKIRMRQACKMDAVRLCKGINPEDKAVIGCLKKNENALSKECRASLPGLLSQE